MLNFFQPTQLSKFQLSNEISPILLNNGIARQLPDSVMPITAILQAGGENGFTYSDYFAHFKNIANGTLAEWQIAEYPFASLVMAANAMIQMPLRISMLMICPAQTDPDRNYIAKEDILTSLQNQIQTHVSQGGTFTVVTPSFTYTEVLLKQIRDVSHQHDKQVQTVWQWDFEQPLITTTGAQQALGNFLGKAEAGLPTPTTWDKK